MKYTDEELDKMVEYYATKGEFFTRDSLRWYLEYWAMEWNKKNESQNSN